MSSNFFIAYQYGASWPPGLTTIHVKLREGEPVSKDDKYILNTDPAKDLHVYKNVHTYQGVFDMSPYIAMDAPHRTRLDAVCTTRWRRTLISKAYSIDNRPGTDLSIIEAKCGFNDDDISIRDCLEKVHLAYGVPAPDDIYYTMYPRTSEELLGFYRDWKWLNNTPPRRGCEGWTPRYSADALRVLGIYWSYGHFVSSKVFAVLWPMLDPDRFWYQEC